MRMAVTSQAMYLPLAHGTSAVDNDINRRDEERRAEKGTEEHAQHFIL